MPVVRVRGILRQVYSRYVVFGYKYIEYSRGELRRSKRSPFVHSPGACVMFSVSWLAPQIRNGVRRKTQRTDDDDAVAIDGREQRCAHPHVCRRVWHSMMCTTRSSVATNGLRGRARSCAIILKRSAALYDVTLCVASLRTNVHI